MKRLDQYMTSKNLYGTFLHVIVVVLAVQVIGLSIQNRELKQRQNPPQQESIKTGDSLSLSGIIPLQRSVAFDSSARLSVIFVFTTRCPFCKETLPIWNRLTQGSTGFHRPTFVGICLDDEEESKAYAEQNELRFPVYIPADKELYVKTNRLHGVPQTIVLSTGGRVEKVWRGRLSHEEFDELSQATLDSTTIQHPHTHLNGGKQ